MSLPHTETEVAEIVEQIQASTSLVEIATDFLQTRDAHWAERDAALNRLGELIQSGSLDPAADDFATSLRAVLSGLVTQLPDLRSQVVRSACASLALLAAEVGDHAALDRPMQQQVLPAVIALISNGNKVLATAGRECLPARPLGLDPRVKTWGRACSRARAAPHEHTTSVAASMTARRALARVRAPIPCACACCAHPVRRRW
jgi:hypothetical protein